MSWNCVPLGHLPEHLLDHAPGGRPQERAVERLEPARHGHGDDAEEHRRSRASRSSPSGRTRPAGGRRASRCRRRPGPSPARRAGRTGRRPPRPPRGARAPGGAGGVRRRGAGGGGAGGARLRSARRRARVGEVDLLAAVGARLHPEAVGVEGLLAEGAAREHGRRAYPGVGAASPPAGAPPCPRRGAGYSEASWTRKPICRTRAKATMARFFMVFLLVPSPTAARPPYFRAPAASATLARHGHGRLQAAPRLQRALGRGAHRRAPRLLRPAAGQPGPGVRVDRLLRQPRPGRDGHRLPARRALRPPQRGEPGGPHRPQHAHRDLLRGAGAAGPPRHRLRPLRLRRREGGHVAARTSASSTAGSRTSRTAPSGTRTSSPRSPTRRPGRGGSSSST